MIAALLSLPLAALIALGCLLLLACWAVAIALAAGNGPDDDGPTDPLREMDRVDSIRAELDAQDAQGAASAWHAGTGERRRVSAGAAGQTPPQQQPFGGTPRIDVDVWSQS